ncbi:calmodulin-like protein 2 [Carica papaya]|nr:calmodulin-like protein 2 [Carica papaya]
MVITSVLLLSLLFALGFFYIFFNFPSTNKLFIRLRSNLFSSHESPSVSIPIAAGSSSARLQSGSRRGELKRVFGTFDKNGDGFITKQELRESMKSMRMSMTETEVEEMVSKLDSNGDGLIDFEEFCLVYDDGSHGEMGEEGGGEETGELKEAFDVFDKDRDGLISVDELGSVLFALGLQEGKRVEDCREMIRKVDVDGDGMVNFDEFKKMMKRGVAGG